MKNRKRSAVILALLLIVFYIVFFLIFQNRQKSENESENDRTQEIVTALEDWSSENHPDSKNPAERIIVGNGERILFYEPSELMSAEGIGGQDSVQGAVRI